jgi:hypothetical protein
MTKKEAYEFVQNTFDDDNTDDDELREAFAAIFEREPDSDEIDNMWSHICSVVSHCGCSTRSQHNRYWISDSVTKDEYQFDGDDITDANEMAEEAHRYASTYDYNGEAGTVNCTLETCSRKWEFEFDEDDNFEFTLLPTWSREVTA